MADWGAGAQGAAQGASAGAAFGPWGALIGGGIGLAGGLLGGAQAGRAARRQDQMYGNAINGLNGTNVEAANAWEGYTEDPGGRDAQLRALAGFQDVADNRGMDATSQADFQRNIGLAAQHARGQREALMSTAAQQGGTRGGNTLAAKLAGVQQDANMVGGAAAQATGDARQRALMAIQGAGQQGGDLRRGDLANAMAKNNATNSINSFNASQRLGRAQSVAGLWAQRGGAANAAGQNQQRTSTGIGQAAGSLVGGAINAFGQQPQQQQQQQPAAQDADQGNPWRFASQLQLR
jgi:hypothetical protein